MEQICNRGDGVSGSGEQRQRQRQQLRKDNRGAASRLFAWSAAMATVPIVGLVGAAAAPPIHLHPRAMLCREPGARLTGSVTCLALR